MRQLMIGLIAEGTTDLRFLKNVIYKSIVELSLQCINQVEIFDIMEISAEGDSFVSKMIDASKRAASDGISILCIHTDSDSRSIDAVIQNKFVPLLDELQKISGNDCCKNIIPTIPIQMIESWMLADKELLKQLINATKLSDTALGIDKKPETYSDPKSTIENAIRIAMAGQTKRRRNDIRISDLYETLGNRLNLESLRTIPSFVSFEENVIKSFKQMGLMR